MAEVYTVNIGPESREEILGGRVGDFIVKTGGVGGDFFFGGDAVDDASGFQITGTVQFYVTSPDEIWVYNQSPGYSGSLKIFHNR